MGHSFGGASALYTAIKLNGQGIKGVIGLDPWLFPMKDLYLEYKLNIPVLFINSETFSNNAPEYKIR